MTTDNRKLNIAVTDCFSMPTDTFKNFVLVVKCRQLKKLKNNKE